MVLFQKFRHFSFYLPSPAPPFPLQFCPAFVLLSSCLNPASFLICDSLAVVVLPRAALLAYPFSLLTAGFFLAIVWSLLAPLGLAVVLRSRRRRFFLATNGF